MMRSTFNVFNGLLSGMLVTLLQAGLLALSSASLAADPLHAPDSNRGGGEIQPPQDDISPATRQRINRNIDATRTRLEALRILPPRNAAPLARSMVSGFAWPLRQAAGRTDNSYYGIANFVDQDSVYATDTSHVKDYFCGTRSYDTASGYNHQGTDIFSWPFSWKKMDNNDVEIVAGAAGTIIGKDDGYFDRSCSMSSDPWNAVYVQHADGSVAWYGHMKNGSLTTKAVGASVSVGEYLGVVGSSGSSTGPHLHLELYDASNNLVDPWLGACNSKSQEVTWSNQPPYYDPTINAITVGPASPEFPDCPTAEISNDTGFVVPGSVGYFTVYLRDQRSTDVVSARWYQPDGSLWKTATSGVPSSYYSSAYWYWYYTFPTSPTGIWRFEATMNGKTVSKNFPVGDAVTPCSYTLSASSASSSSSLTHGTVSVASNASCTWEASSNANWLTITSGTSGSGNGTVAYTVAANTGTTTRTGTLTIAGKTFTVTQAGVPIAAPVCTLSANPSSITAGSSATLTASCTPAATSYIWTGGTCAGTTGTTCTTTPTATTTYSVAGTNAGGTNQAASATVTVMPNTTTTSYTVPGTLGSDVFVLTAGNSYYGGAGNDTFIISPNTLQSDVTAKIIDTEGDNFIQLVDGLTLTASTFYADAAQLTLSNGAKVQILGASRFKYQAGANLLAGDGATVLTYSGFATSLGASLNGTLPTAGTAGYVVPTAFTQAAAPVPGTAGSSYTVPGTLGNDVLAPSGGNNYLGGGGGDIYIISPYALSGTVTAKIIDTEGGNVIQLVKGLTIASSSFYTNAVQLTLSSGALVQILGASSFIYQLGANAPAGETATNLSYAQFAAALGARVPTTGVANGSPNFVVPSP
ncbi:MAG: peptidoglycan DD-metalloendopeptidase family protein [Rhodoferax sp.]|nr:peptidoglycan DD-metalloendopeptidase family protein [Rhodoferax sp.]